ncbi:hypothetical protein HPC49_36330 [Pyxidicoccus fallax]|uniref:Uncharacterized protein n=1 Tax=Pyxidicoccus fallax TaxID=394095 RepID=A0A848LCP3_9BACT|nr:hypothetical protein [Pyxidicoccus fallax]NMO14513.1 hypothetical protein [Pyxidicoccus fallax]NPC83673.1 hypothetical protein [Pyxidicoccus fallax]
MGLDLTIESKEFGGNAGPSATRQPAVTRVQLRRDWIRYRDASGADVILDFARRRRIEINGDARTYVDESLFPDVDFRHSELPNRDHIQSVLEAGGADVSDFGPVLSEHHLSVLDRERKRTIDAPKSGGLGGLLRSVIKPARGDISVESAQGHTVFSAAGRRLLSYSDGGTKTSPELARRFGQFLRYRFCGHPLIIDRLVSEGRIPTEIDYESCHPQGMPHSNATVRIKAVDTVRDDSLPLDGHRRVMDPGLFPEEITACLERVMLVGVPMHDRVMAQRMAEAKESAEAGRRLEMVLTLFELTLETGASVPGFGEAVRSDGDVHVRRLVDALTRPPNSEAEARARVSTFENLRPYGGRKAHVLGTFEAPVQRSLGEHDVAQALLLAAIESNPFLAGAYKDLGDIYLGGYETRKAWLCWEAARRIAPEHSLVEGIVAREQLLAAAHPEYF